MEALIDEEGWLSESIMKDFISKLSESLGERIDRLVDRLGDRLDRSLLRLEKVVMATYDAAQTAAETAAAVKILSTIENVHISSLKCGVVNKMLEEKDGIVIIQEHRDASLAGAAPPVAPSRHSWSKDGTEPSQHDPLCTWAHINLFAGLDVLIGAANAKEPLSLPDGTVFSRATAALLCSLEFKKPSKVKAEKSILQTLLQALASASRGAAALLTDAKTCVLVITTSLQHNAEEKKYHPVLVVHALGVEGAHKQLGCNVSSLAKQLKAHLAKPLEEQVALAASVLSAAVPAEAAAGAGVAGGAGGADDAGSAGGGAGGGAGGSGGGAGACTCTRRFCLFVISSPSTTALAALTAELFSCSSGVHLMLSGLSGDSESKPSFPPFSSPYHSAVDFAASPLRTFPADPAVQATLEALRTECRRLAPARPATFGKRAASVAASAVHGVLSAPASAAASTEGSAAGASTAKASSSSAAPTGAADDDESQVSTAAGSNLTATFSAVSLNASGAAAAAAAPAVTPKNARPLPAGTPTAVIAAPGESTTITSDVSASEVTGAGAWIEKGSSVSSGFAASATVSASGGAVRTAHVAASGTAAAAAAVAAAVAAAGAAGAGGSAAGAAGGGAVPPTAKASSATAAAAARQSGAAMVSTGGAAGTAASGAGRRLKRAGRGESWPRQDLRKLSAQLLAGRHPIRLIHDHYRDSVQLLAVVRR